MKTTLGFALVLFVNLMNLHCVFADDSVGTCANGAVKKPGILTVDCSVLVPSLSAQVKLHHFQLTPADYLGGIDIDIPVTVPHPENYSEQILHYNVTAYNVSNDCSFPANEQLMLILSQRRSFCNPPGLKGDPNYHQTCSFPEEENGLQANDLKPLAPGARLSISEKNQTLSVECKASFEFLP